jgi:hypothetical protein
MALGGAGLRYPFMEAQSEQIQTFRDLRRKERSGYGRWLLLIKELRVTHNTSILDAERLALSNRHRRRWVEKAINSNLQCRKRALAHIRYNKEASLIEREGDSFRFRIRWSGQ